jgi:hypothetical protein
MTDFSIGLKIKVPIICECSHNCICRNFIKCKNGCFCGNFAPMKQKKSEYAAKTPDYNSKKIKILRKSYSSVSFSSFDIFEIEKLIYHSPRYFITIDLNKKIKNRSLSPQLK